MRKRDFQQDVFDCRLERRGGRRNGIGWLYCRLSVLLGAALLLLASAATAGLVQTENVSARLIAERGQVAPGDRVELALVLDIRPHWHTYWRNPGDSGEPPRIEWQLPDGVEAGAIRWPAPSLILVGPLANFGYSGRATHLVELSVSEGWPVGEPITVGANATWLVCEEECIPEQGSFELTLATADDSGRADPAVAPLFAEARARLPEVGVIAAHLTPDADGMQLQIPAAPLPSEITEARFFPNAWGLVEHAADQPWQRDGDSLVMQLIPGATPSAVAAAGLLVVEGADGPRSYQIDASGTMATAAEPADPDPLGLPTALLFALLGGLVLNLMPCVFPVLAIKALGLAQQAGLPLRERAKHGLAYSAGVLGFFLLVGLLLLGLRAGGAAVGWGFQLQSPPFVTLMAYLFLILGLSLAGAVTLGTRLMGIGATGPAAGQHPGQHPGRHQRHLGAFMTGALAALVAAPCTAPFMGAALGYAVTLPWPPALAIVLSLGFGMALPLLLLTLMPRLGSRLPRPGAWMEHLKQLLSFPMFATAAWLVWVLSVQTGPDGVAAVLTGMVALTFALWLIERGRNASVFWRQATLGLAVLGLAASLWLGFDTARLGSGRLDTGPAMVSDREAASDAAASLAARPYSAQTLDEARAAGRPVFVNMTAAWCITCLVNERMALSSAAVARAFAKHDVLYLKGDWTNRDPQITAYLAGFGRNGVPIYVFYTPAGDARVLPQILTESLVLEVLRGA
jgi:thiol:disulfide interchange protein DsbD